MAIAPWLTPTDVIGSMSRGASLGLQERSQDTQESEAADRLKLAYDQMASEERRQSDRAAQALLLKQAEMAGLNAYRQGELQNRAAANAIAQQRANDLANHYAALEKQKNASAAASIVTHDEFPGVKFLRQPTGHEQVINSGELTPSQKLEHTERAYGMMKLGANEFGDEPSYQARTNAAAAILKEVAPKTGAKSTGRVRVKSPDGKVGTIPADQLDDAVSAGYEKVQ